MRDFATQDGPSHVYNAVVARSLILHPHSEYASVYAFHRAVVPNWGSTAVLGLITGVAGVAHAEQLFVSLALCAGFFSFAYAIRAVAPGEKCWTPLTNFLLQTWFLWAAFYSFYLAMVLCPLLIGYYVRHASAFTLKRAAALGAGLAALFFTHLMPAAIAVLAIAVIAIWEMAIAPGLFTAKYPPARTVIRRLTPVGLALAPTLILLGWFAVRAPGAIGYRAGIGMAFKSFPMYVFFTSPGIGGDQFPLYAAVLWVIVLVIVTLRRGEWTTAAGGLAISTVVLFLAYLLVPDEGLGGGRTKLRLAWGVFVLGGLLLATAGRFRPWRAAFDVFVCASLIVTLISTEGTLRRYSDAVRDYLRAAEMIPRGAHFVRLRYPTPDVDGRYGFQGIESDPLRHLDSYAALQCECVDLTDFQALNDIFPVVLNRSVPENQRLGLRSLETPDAFTDPALRRLQSTLPWPIDYVIVMADESTPEGDASGAVLRRLDSEMRLVGTSGDRPFVRVYQRR